MVVCLTVMLARGHCGPHICHFPGCGSHQHLMVLEVGNSAMVLDVLEQNCWDHAWCMCQKRGSNSGSHNGMVGIFSHVSMPKTLLKKLLETSPS